MDLTPGDERDTWQADAVDASTRGMALRAAVLPEVGEELSLSVHGPQSVAARAEVVWASDKGPSAGTFGVRFTEVTPKAEQSLRRMLDVKDDVMAEAAPAANLPPPDARVKLFIHGMDAPLRARVRRSEQGEMIVGSDLSFLKLGDKVDVEGGGGKAQGAIVKVDVEVDPRTRVPKLVLTIDLGGRRKIELGTAPTVMAESPRASEVDLPTVKVPAARATKPLVEVAPELHQAHQAHEAPQRQTPASERPEPRRVAQATTVLGGDGADEPEAQASHDDALGSMEMPPGWITQGVRAVRGAVDKVNTAAGPAVRRAADAMGALRERIQQKRAQSAGGDAEASADEAPRARKGLRPQHPAAAEQSDPGDAVVTSPGKRNRKVGLYAVVGLVLAAGVVAYASSSGPRVEAPRPQVAVSADGNADPNADPNAAQPTDPNAAPTAEANAAQPVDPNAAPPEAPAEEPAAQPEPRMLGPRAPRTADLAAAATSPNAQGDMETPVFQRPAPRPMARPMAPARPAPVAVRAPQPLAPQAFAQRPAVAARPVAPAQPVVAQGPARPAVFGNPAVRNGTVLRLRMDGPIGSIAGVGARGAQIVLTVPGRHSLDMAAPLAQVDPRISGAGVYNRANGAELTLRFREAAPPFVARSRGNTLEIVLGATPGQPVRAAVRTPVVVGRRP